ncbi:MAG: FtsX-like permease family protein [Candidatus Udaeobacter sp.]
MTPPLYIALRFLTHRKRALLLSLSGVVFGVAIFICTQAQTQGLSRYFIESNIGSNGALVVRSRFRPRYEPLMVAAKNSKASTGRRLYFEGITNPNEIMRVSRQFPDVISCSPVLRGTVSARAGFENATVDLYGIDPALHARTTDILRQLIDGRFDNFRNNTSAIIIGSRLAELLQTSVGDTVQLLAPNGEYWRFSVAAIARAGIGSIDSTRIYSHAKVAQALLQQPSGATMIIYKLRDRNRAPVLARRFETIFQHNALSWQEREESTLQLFLTLRMSVAITVSLIILLAGFGIFNVLTMSVLAKIKEIAILRSMGYRRRDISAIFLWQGALIAAAGSVLGCVLGALMTWGVSHIPIHLRGLLYTNYFLVTWDWRHYAFATLLALLAVFIASYVPARRAAELPPVVTIRGSR